MSLLEQDIIQKGQINIFPVPEFEVGNNKKYELKAIQDSTIYIKKANRYLSGPYYLVLYKDYLKEENT